MKPFRIFLFFFFLLLLLAVGYSLLPGKPGRIAGINIRNPAGPVINRLFHSGLSLVSPIVPRIADTNENPGNLQPVKFPRMNFTDSLMSRIPSLEYPDSVSDQWFSMIRYFRSLQGKKLTTHIFHYGDSQIEGDRITAVLRDSLQRWFGGGGPGLFLPVMTVPVTSTLRIDADEHWKKEACDLLPENKRTFPPVGIFMEHVYVVPEKENTGKYPVRTSFEVTIQHFAAPLAKNSGRYRIWLRGDTGIIKFTIRIKQEEFSYSVTLSRTLQEISGVLTGFSGKAGFIFETSVPLIIEGVSLEKSPGILVDNIPLRGRTMARFSSVDKEELALMLTDMNVKLVILQFGLNSIAGGETGVKAYATGFRHQLSVLRSVRPDIMVLVIGTTDMNMTAGVSDPLSGQLSNIQRKVAMEEGCLFWDSYRAMGGSGAAEQWLENDPPLIRPDYVHLSREGSRLLASMLAVALRREINAVR